MRFFLALLALLPSVLCGQELIDDSRLTWWTNPYIGPDGLVLRSSEDNITAAEWPEAKRSAYAQYPLALEMPEGSIPRTAESAYALLKAQGKPIAIGHRLVHNKTWGPARRRIILWLEPRPKFLNDDELKAAALRGEFDALFPAFPIGEFAPVGGQGLGSRYADFPTPSIGTLLTLHGIRPKGEKGELYPIEANIHLYSAWSLLEEDLVTRVIEDALIDIGGGSDQGDEVVQIASGTVMKIGQGTQFGHVGYRWVSGGNDIRLNILGKAPGVLEACVRQQPSALPRDLTITRANEAALTLQYGLARLRSAPPVLDDDDYMIRIQPYHNRNQFGRGADLLRPFKELWPVIYGYQRAHRDRYWQNLSPDSKVFSWQAYIDKETASRAEVLRAVANYAEQAQRRGLVRREKVPRQPWVEWAADALPPCFELGTER